VQFKLQGLPGGLSKVLPGGKKAAASSTMSISPAILFAATVLAGAIGGL
jgi:hypothetical protein